MYAKHKILDLVIKNRLKPRKNKTNISKKQNRRYMEFKSRNKAIFYKRNI